MIARVIEFRVWRRVCYNLQTFRQKAFYDSRPRTITLLGNGRSIPNEPRGTLNGAYTILFQDLHAATQAIVDEFGSASTVGIDNCCDAVGGVPFVRIHSICSHV